MTKPKHLKTQAKQGRPQDPSGKWPISDLLITELLKYRFRLQISTRPSKGHFLPSLNFRVNIIQVPGDLYPGTLYTPAPGPKQNFNLGGWLAGS